MMCEKEKIEERMGTARTVEGGLDVDLSSLALLSFPNVVLKRAAEKPIASLSFKNNKLTELPSEMEQLAPTLTCLNLDNNNFIDTPSVIALLHALQEVHLRFNKLSGELNVALCGLPLLTHLDLSCNRLTRIPPNIQGLTHLKTLNLFHNFIVAVDPALFSIASLQSLNLGSNQIREIPSEIGNLSSLTELDISNNNITRLPVELVKLGEIKTLSLLNNPWECPSQSICMQGTEEIFKELRRLASATGSPKFCQLVGVTNTLPGKAIRFTIVSKDSNNVPRVSGGDNFLVQVTGQVGDMPVAGVESDVIDNKNGTYTVTLMVPQPGTYNLRILLNSIPLQQCPVLFTVFPPIVGDAEISQLDKIELGDDVDIDLAFQQVDDSHFQQYGRLLQLSREFNFCIPIPEIVVCGSGAISHLPEAIFGFYPFDFGDLKLKRPLVIHMIYNAECGEPKVILKRDRAFGTSVTGGMRDLPMALPDLLEHLQARNKDITPVPMYVHIEHSGLMTATVFVTPDFSFNTPGTAPAATAQVEDIVLDLIKPHHRLLYCVQPCMDWKLVQMSPWVSLILKADPTFTRTKFIFSGMNEYIQSLHSTSLLNGFFQRHLFPGSCYFLSFLSSPVRKTCSSKSDYQKRILQTERRDFMFLESNNFDQRFRPFIGAMAIRKATYQFIVEQYQTQTPMIWRKASDSIKSTTGQLNECVALHDLLLSEKSDLPSTLRELVSNYTEKFCLLFDSLIKGSALGSPAAMGISLPEELALTQETYAIPPVKELGVENDMCHIFGGSQLVRTLEHFRHLCDTVQLPNLAGISDILPSNVNPIFAASQFAQREVATVMTPLINQLCDRALFDIKHTTSLVEKLLASNSLPDTGKHDSGICKRIAEFSYISKHVKELFLEMVSQQAEQFKEKCTSEDFSNPCVLWDMPFVSAKELGDAKNRVSLINNIFSKLIKSISESVSMRFYNMFLYCVTATIPHYMHSTLLSLEDSQIKKLFQLEALQAQLDKDIATLKNTVSDFEAKESVAKSISLY
ncbi:dynamin family protein [Pelomyxa schiedti]|nr:dynamin family protein [Pelomyxa schiedti]